MDDDFPMTSAEDLLLHPPASSRERLQAALAPSPALAPWSGQARAIDWSRSWLQGILRPPHAPPPSTLFLAFPSEKEQADIVRASYPFAPSDPTLGRLEVALSFSVAALTLWRPHATPCLEHAQQVADELFAPSRPIELVLAAGDEREAHGLVRSWKTTPHAFWEQDLRWWCSPDHVSFTTLQGNGGLTQKVFSFDLLFNRVWFKAVADDHPPKAGP